VPPEAQYTNTSTVACSTALTTSSNLRSFVCASFSFAEPHVSGRVGRRPWHLPEKIWPLLAGECLPRAVSCLFPGRRCHLLAGRCHPPDKRCLPFAAGCLHLYRRCRAQVDNGALCFKDFFRDTASSRWKTTKQRVLVGFWCLKESLRFIRENHLPFLI